MSDPNSTVSPPPNSRRKSFVEMLNPRAFGNSSSMSTSPSNAVAPSPGVPMQRKSSISMALGLSGGGNSQETPYNSFSRQRRASISNSSAGSPEFRNSFDESAVIEDDDKVPPMNTPPSPSFARRLSFGAQAMRDVRQTGTSPTNNAGEGFNWSESMRNRNQRTLSSGNPFGGHNRSKSFNAPATEPPKEISQPAPPPAPAPAPAPLRSKKPDHLGERMLRGDFMMD